MVSQCLLKKDFEAKWYKQSGPGDQVQPVLSNVRYSLKG